MVATKTAMFSELRLALAGIGETQGSVAEYLKTLKKNGEPFSQACISMKFTGKQQWRLDEMYALLDLIGADDSEMDIYFPRNGGKEK